jgi:hypothetical protein
VSLALNKKQVFYRLYYLCNDLFPVLERTNIIVKTHIKVCHVIIKDVNIFAEKKTNLGLFAIKQYFNIKLFFIGIDSSLVNILLKNLKISLI